MGKKYLITGGLGFIGKAITLSLLSKNNTVIIADNNFRKKKNDLKHKNLYVHKIDVRKKNQLKKICKDIDSVIHLAFINGTNFFYEKPELVLEVGIKGIINLIEGCEENFIKEFFLFFVRNFYCCFYSLIMLLQAALIRDSLFRK